MQPKQINYVFKTNSKAICCNRNFYISSRDEDQDSYHLLFNPPSMVICRNELSSRGLFVNFSLTLSELASFKDSNLTVHHIVEYIHKISSRNFSYDGLRLYVYVIGDKAMFILKRITDFMLVQVFNFYTPEDLIYYIQYCFKTQQLDKASDKLILCGEITEDSKLYSMLSIYFKNLIVDTAQPATSLDEV